MKYTLHPSKEGFIATSDELPKDQEGYWTYIGFNEPIIVTKCNQSTGWFEKLWDKHNYKTVIAQQDQIDFSALSEEEQKEIGWFDTVKFAKEEHMFNHKLIHEMSFILGVEVGFQRAQELLSDRRFTLKDIIEYTKWLQENASRNNAGKWVCFDNNFYDKTNEEMVSKWQSLSQKSWDIEGEFINNKFKITKIL